MIVFCPTNLDTNGSIRAILDILNQSICNIHCKLQVLKYVLRIILFKIYIFLDTVCGWRSIGQQDGPKDFRKNFFFRMMHAGSSLHGMKFRMGNVCEKLTIITHTILLPHARRKCVQMLFCLKFKEKCLNRM